MDGAPRHLVDRRGVALEAGGGEVAHRLEAEEAVPGHEHVLDHDRVRPGAAQADHVPDVVDLVVRARDQEAAEIDGAAVLEDRATDDDPRGMVAPGGPGPRAIDPVAAVHDLAGAHRGVGGGDAHVGILGPYVLLGLLREQGQVPVVDTDDPGHPSGGAARARDVADSRVEQYRVGLVAAPLLRLEQPEEPRLLQRLDRVVGDAAKILGLLCTFPQGGQQRVDPLQYLVALVVAHWTLPSVPEMIACFETRTRSHSCRDRGIAARRRLFCGTKVPDRFRIAAIFYNVFY